MFGIYVSIHHLISCSTNEDFGEKKSIHLVRCQSFIIENLLPFLIFFCLAALKHTILIGEYEFHIPGRGNQIAAFIRKTDPVFEACIAVRQKLTVIDHPRKAGFIEYLYAVDISEKTSARIVVRKEKANKIRIHFHCSLVYGIAKECPILGKEPFILF